MNTNHAKAIKGLSIANIVLAALGIFGCFIACAGLGVGGAAIAGSGYDYIYTDDGFRMDTGDVAGLLGFMGIFVFLGVICLIFVLVAGIMGVRGADKPEKLKGVMTWNIVGAVASFLTGGLITLVLCIIVAVFANKDKQIPACNAPYGAQPYGAPVQPQAPVAPQAPVVPQQPVAAEAVTATEVAAAEPAVIIPDNYIEDARAGVTIIEETSGEDEQK